MEVFNTTGRRKSSVARVYLKPGKGNFTINNRKFEEYFPTGILQTIVKQPLALLAKDGEFDIYVNVNGGGFKGQAEAIRLGISRALVAENEESKPALRKEGFMTRDPREVERKKYGRRKARRRFQFSKR
ncbi:MAG: 30S ribosomal protein S9 [Cyclobacteriaceae bacterium]|nr:30S ribosomal protein S9 [Cyclobacteriaceae bacterium]